MCGPRGRPPIRLAPCWLLTAPLFVGCGADDPAESNVWEVEVDLVHAEEMVSIPRSDGAEGVVFGRVAGAALDQAGRIHVLDAQAQGVLVFDGTGAYLHRLGGPGEGPGEFSRPTWLSVVGDEVTVRHARGTTTFQGNGELLDERMPTNTRSIRSWRVGDRGFVEAVIYGAGREQIDPRLTLVLAGRDGAVDTLAVGQAAPLYVRSPTMATALPSPMCDSVHFGVGPGDRIFVADGERGTLSRYRWGDTLALDAEWDVAPPGEPVPPERVAELLERVAEVLEEMPAQLRHPDEEIVAPSVDPRLCGVLVEGETRVWVRLKGVEREAPDEPAGVGAPADALEPPEMWRALDFETGRPLLDVEFPAGVQVHGFGEGDDGTALAVGVDPDELGVQSVRLYRARLDRTP